MSKMTLNIATEFSDTPGGRHKVSGKHSAEEFYESLLKPRFEYASKNNLKLNVVFDEIKALPEHFIDEAFGQRLASEFGVDRISQHLTLTSKDNPDYMKKVLKIIRQFDFVVCDKCGRKSTEGKIGAICNKPRDNEFLPCTGRFKKL